MFRLLQYILFSLFVFSISKSYSQSNALSGDSFHLSEAVIVAQNIKQSATWYRKYLNLDIKEYKPMKHVKMQTALFTLWIKQKNNLLLKANIRLPEGKKYINGITKIGFSTNRFDSIYQVFQKKERQYLSSIEQDKNIDIQYFITEDPEGNRVQLFDLPNDSEKMTMIANFFSIASSDFIHTMRWYEQNIDFFEIEIKDNSKIYFQNLLRKNTVIFEIIHLPYSSLEITEFMPIGKELACFQQLIFRSNTGKNTPFVMDNNGNQIQWKK